VPYFLSLLAEVNGRSGAVNEGFDLVAEALDRVGETGERWFEAELHRMAGELMLRLPKSDPAAAEARFRQAAVIARQQGTRLWELRAAARLAQLWRELGRCAEAHDLLAPLHSQFTEGFGTPDLQTTWAILRETTTRSELENPPPNPGK
jgi:predicted ATPase